MEALRIASHHLQSTKHKEFSSFPNSGAFLLLENSFCFLGIWDSVDLFHSLSQTQSSQCGNEGKSLSVHSRLIHLGHKFPGKWQGQLCCEVGSVFCRIPQISGQKFMAQLLRDAAAAGYSSLLLSGKSSFPGMPLQGPGM